MIDDVACGPRCLYYCRSACPWDRHKIRANNLCYMRYGIKFVKMVGGVLLVVRLWDEHDASLEKR